MTHWDVLQGLNAIAGVARFTKGQRDKAMILFAHLVNLGPTWTPEVEWKKARAIVKDEVFSEYLYDVARVTIAGVAAYVVPRKSDDYLAFESDVATAKGIAMLISPLSEVTVEYAHTLPNGKGQDG